MAHHRGRDRKRVDAERERGCEKKHQDDTFHSGESPPYAYETINMNMLIRPYGHSRSMALPELRALKENLVQYEIAAAEERQKRDLLVATWRDILHESMNSPGAVNMIHLIHQVMDNMDEFLRRSKK